MGVGLEVGGERDNKQITAELLGCYCEKCNGAEQGSVSGSELVKVRKACGST